MEFKDIQKKVVNNANGYGRDFGIKIDKDFCVLKLIEEVGELAEAILTHEKKSRPEKFVSVEVSKEHLARELADVLGMVMVTASVFDINLEDALNEKWIDKRTS